MMRNILKSVALVALAGCGVGELTVPAVDVASPSYAVSDALHSGGTAGFYFLPPLVPAPNATGAFDADIGGLDPQVLICDLSADADCGGATPALATFTSASTPAITVDPTAGQYHVNWNTKAPGFDAGHTYRVHVRAGASGSRRELGFAEVLLTASPGQAKNVATSDVIVLNDGQTLPIKFRVEAGIVGSIAVSMDPAEVRAGNDATGSAAVRDLHGNALGGHGVLWSSSGVSLSIATPNGTTNGAGVASTTVTAGSTTGTATVFAQSGGLSGSATLTVTPASYDEWSTGSAMLTPRRAFGGMIAGKLYVAGGWSSTPFPYDLLEVYDPSANSWQQKAPMPTARSDAAAAVLDGKLYVVGGWDAANTPLASLQIYDPASNTWTTGAPLPRGRGYPAASAANGKLYVFGGLTGPSQSYAVADVDIYDPATDSWSTGAQMMAPRYVASAATLNGVIYVVAGYNAQHGYGEGLATVEVYDPATDSWSSGPSLNYRRGQTPALAALEGKLYAAGGFCWYCFLYYPGGNGPQGYLSVVEEYDPASGVWSVKAPMPAARYGQVVGAWGGWLYLAGGERDYAVPASDLFVYRP
jgi:N-acetylneuraminic acid mutarotase